MPSFVSNSLAKLSEENWDERTIQDVAGTMYAGEHYSSYIFDVLLTW